MSAYMIDRNHVRYLIEAALHLAESSAHREDFQFLRPDGWERIVRDCYKRSGHMTATQAGQMLWDENMKSVLHRYPDCSPDNVPGEIGEQYAYEHEDYMIGPFKFDLAQIIKACSCYEYQTCEHPGNEKSDALSFIKALRHMVCTALPGYENAVWGAPKMPAPTRVRRLV